MAQPKPASETRNWGGSRVSATRLRIMMGFPWSDVLVAFAVAGMMLAVIAVARAFSRAHLPTGEPEEMRLELPYLGLYTLYSLARGLLAYCLSLVFAIGYGYWAAKDKVAEKLLLPLLDILQSIPVLTFMPGFLWALVVLFPSNDIGQNLASILFIFTGQVWNMVFSFYHSLKSISPDLYEAGAIYRFGVWRRFSRIELPASATGLVWNSMMSMAGGWFFLSICEAFDLQGGQFQLQGLGSYIKVAQERGDVFATVAGMTAMVLMIVLMNQLLWRPLTVWAQRFKTGDVAAAHTEESLVLTLLRDSKLLWLGHRVFVAPVTSALDRFDLGRQAADADDEAPPAATRWLAVLRVGLWGLIIGLAVWGLYLLVALLAQVTVAQWAVLVQGTGLTLLRVLAAVALGTAVMVPVGVLIGLRPRLAGRLQPVIQVLASFPAPMLFALFLVVFDWINLSLSWGSVLLMTAGTQWYILFNVLGGAMAIPADLHEAAAVYRWSRWERWRHLYLPAVFPFLVTGWVTAAGGAWNASIVAEYWKVAGQAEVAGPARPDGAPPDAASPVKPAAVPPRPGEPWEHVLFDGTAPADPRVRRAFGLGAVISRATEEARFPVLAAAALIMAATVVLINRTLWRRLELLAEKRFSLNR